MEGTQQHDICGFVPPYILEAIQSSETGSDELAEVSRNACKHTLEHINLYCGKRRELYTETYVSPHSAGSGFIPGYILDAITDQKEAADEHKGAAQHALKATDDKTSTAVQRKVYDCKDSDELPGTLVRSEGQARIKDRQVNNVYDGFGITHNFYKEVFGRNSLDDKGIPLIGHVHYKDPESPAGFNNAFWDGEGKRMVFGDGDDITFDYLTDSLDVIGHELSHGFVQFSSPLKYQGQSGALNESMADVFGAMVEQWHMKQTADDADWIIGQTIFPVAFTGCALRTMKAGKAYVDDPVFGTDPQPKHMKNIYSGPKDAGGVHINSGIPNHAFYLAAKAIGGKSWEKAGKVWYKTMTSGKIPNQCDFKTFANTTVEIAEKEFAADASVKKAIHDAWVQVGVLTA